MMVLQVVGALASIATLVGILWNGAVFVYRLARQPEGVPFVLTGVVLLSFTTLAVVLVGLLLVVR